MFHLIKVSEIEFIKTNYKRLKKHWFVLKKLIDSDGNMCLTVDTLIEITASNSIIFRDVNVKSYGFDKMCTDKYLIEDKLYQIIDQSKERKIMPVKFYLILFHEIHSFYDGNGRFYNKLF